MFTRHHYRKLTCAVCALVSALAVAFVELPTGVDGPLLDLLVKARELALPSGLGSKASEVVVIALDKRSLMEPEIAVYPRTLLAPIWASVMDAAFNAGARAVGFDILFSYSANRIKSNFDAPFLRRLHKYRDRVVLARSASTLPARPFLASMRNDPHALGLTELSVDADGTYRRIRAEYRTRANESITGFAAALLRRAKGPAMPAEVILAPYQHLEKQITTYSLIDVLRCAERAPEVLQEALGNKIILIGGNLPEEDRKISSNKYLTPERNNSTTIHPCGLRRLGASLPDSQSIPAVFIHAAAVEAVMNGRLLRVAPKFVVATLAAVTAIVGVALGLLLTPWLVAATIGLSAAVIFGIATAMLSVDVWLPLAIPMAALVLSPTIAYMTRYLVEEKVRRRVEHAFGHFISPLVVARIESDPSALKLGGQAREISVMFADLSGFTKLSTQVPPETLMRITNQYLTYIVEQVEATGGYVDKFIGDAVMVIWGAPAADPGHAVHSICAALETVARILYEKKSAEARGEIGFSIKIGINSGTALVGNVGTEKRYRYTAVGETVNVASRLEGLPSLYGCHLVVGPQTAKLVKNEFLMRELDTVRVKDVETPLTVFEPLVETGRATPDQIDRVHRYEEALALYRDMRFSDAIAIWTSLAQMDPTFTGTQGEIINPPAVMAERAKTLAATPPDSTWNGVWTRTEK